MAVAERECDGVSVAVINTNHHSDSSREIKPVGVDFISSLPDAILQHILVFIPTKFGIRTSLLSKRWKRVWQETPSISIRCDREDHVESIEKTLSSYSSLKITSFHVSIRCSITTMHVDRWIELAASRNADNLSLEFEYYGDFPNFFYINPSLKHLSLKLWHGCADLDPKCTVSWTSLRNLSLSYCTLSDESIANVLSGCPILESLILIHCAGIHRLDLSISVNLTRFEMIGNQPVEIVAPHIHYLRLTSIHKPPTLVDISSLTEANFNISYPEYRRLEDAGNLQHMVLNVLTKLQNVEKLTIGAVLLQILSLAEIRDVPFPQFKIKALTVETMFAQSFLPGIVRLLQNSPGLKKITVHTTKCQVIPDREFDRYLSTQGLINDRCWSWHFPTVEKTSWLFNSGHVAFFVELAMWNAKTLETMVIRLGGYLNATEYQTLISWIPVYCRNTLAILKSLKIFP